MKLLVEGKQDRKREDAGKKMWGFFKSLPDWPHSPTVSYKQLTDHTIKDVSWKAKLSCMATHKFLF